MRHALVVHLDDLRLVDHRLLHHALAENDIVYGICVVDSAWFVQGPHGLSRMGPKRLQWRLRSIEQLRRAYRARGGT